ncbi:MAG: AMP-binding protein [Bacteroidales bacterium]|nr:AMP-binding protein [Bacteroidales bacterium]
MHNYKQLTFSTIIPDVVSRFAQNKAMSYVDDEPITYAQMGVLITATMAFLEDMGVKPNDKVVIYSQNMPHWGIVYFALHSMGIVAVPVLPDFNVHELKNVIKHSDAKVVFVSKSLEHKLKEADENLVETIIRLDNFDILKSKTSLKFDEQKEYTGSYHPDENNLAVLLYTSGTTGASKGVMLSQKNIITNAYQSNHMQEILEHDKFLSVLPMSHTYENTIGLILPILKGANITYLRKPPTASVLLPALKKVKPDLMLTVPMIIEKVYRNSILPEIEKKTVTRLMHKFGPSRKLLYRLAGKKLMKTFGGNLKFFGIGGAKLNGQVEQFLRDAKFPYAIGYGLTETAPILAGSNPSQTKLQAIGPKAILVDLKINNPDPKTGEGEIWAKGPNVMLGYYKNEENTQEVMTKDGWFKTGDLGVFDKNGWLSHRGRLKNMIVGANGENIYPEEIESLINNFSHVIESIVLEKKGKLVAMVHFNREELELKMKEIKAEVSQKVDETIEEFTIKVDKTIDELAIELQNYVNARVNRTSKIQLLIAHPDPFQKTATKKIKRYLYF